MDCYANDIKVGGVYYSREKITPELLREIKVKMIAGSLASVSAGARDSDLLFIEIDIKDGWAAIMISNEEDGVWHYYRNKKYDDLSERAPVYFGGQSEAPKAITCDDLSLAADIFEEWVVSGTRYDTTWACFAAETDGFTEW